MGEAKLPLFYIWHPTKNGKMLMVMMPVSFKGYGLELLRRNFIKNLGKRGL